MRTRTLIASLVTAIALTGCSAAADESESPNPRPSASTSPTGSATDSPEAPKTSSTATPEVSDIEITSAKPARPKGWVGPEDGITIASDVTDKKSAEAAANAAMAFLRKWTLREDLMRMGGDDELLAALSGVTPELSSNAAAAWQQNLDAAAGSNSANAWANLTALVRSGSSGRQWQIPANEPLVTNRAFVGDAYVSNQQNVGGLRVNIDYAANFTGFAKPNKPKAGYIRYAQDGYVSLVMTNNEGNGWRIFSWESKFGDLEDPVRLN